MRQICGDSQFDATITKIRSLIPQSLKGESYRPKIGSISLKCYKQLCTGGRVGGSIVPMTLILTMIALMERHMSSPNLAAQNQRTTIAHRISRVAPTPVVRALRPKWHLAREVFKFRFGRGGRLTWVNDLRCWQATVQLPRGTLYVPVRSYRNLRQITQFGADPKSLVFDWLNAIDDCEMLYDIGASNGYEGM